MLPDGSITLHRTDLLDILIINLPDFVSTYFSKRLVRYEDDVSGGISLHFADGTSATADVLIGADGYKSATRATLYKLLATKESNSEATHGASPLLAFVPPTWTGTFAYRTLISVENLKRKNPQHQAASTPIIVSLHI